MRILFFSLGLLIGTLFMTSCGSEGNSTTLAPKPFAFGKIREVTLIADQDLLDSPVGDTFLYYYTGAYPLLPQPEPLLDLRHFTPEDLRKDALRKELRILIFAADLSDEDSPTANMIKADLGEERIRAARENEKLRTSVGRDKWAKNQLIIYMYAFGREELAEVLKSNFDAVIKRIEQMDSERLDATVYLDGENYKLNKIIQEEYDLKLRVPGEYFLAINDQENKVLWMRKETPEYSSNIMLTTMPYTDPAQLSAAGLKAVRDSLGRKYISSEIPNSYMLTNDVDLPLLTYQTKMDGNFAVEGRGVWEIENDFMGGPFVGYLIHDPEQDRLVYLDGFVYAPGKDKRNYMLYLDYILHTIQL